MNPKYSVLWNNQSLQIVCVKIRDYLSEGIKVIWFGDRESVLSLNK